MLKILKAGNHRNVRPGLNQILLEDYRAAFIDEANVTPTYLLPTCICAFISFITRIKKLCY